MLEDRLLIRRFNHGDGDALCRIYRKYRDDLLKVAGALLNDGSAAEDVVHDVFVTFARSAGDFRLRGSLKGYLAICAANRARDRNRAVRRAPTVDLDQARPVRANTPGPDQSAMHRELAGRLANAMTQLPYEQREVIVLHLQSSIRFAQIAESQGVSANTARSRYRYGLDRLRSILNGELRQ